MYHNIGVNWKIFEYKFSCNVEAAFQQLAYTLFCAEYGLPSYGVFGYHNQIGIETEPISFDNHVIGFQAKYYAPTTSLSSKARELIKMIDDSKGKNPNLTKILIYTNKELSESRKSGQKKPKYQENIEGHGKNKGVIIEWRVKSNFEALLSSGSVPAYVSDYFFNADNGIREFNEQMLTHTDMIINNIENLICYGNKSIYIDRPFSKIDEFMASDHKCLIIYGESGSGKSGIIKSFILAQKEKNEKERYPIFTFRTTDFGYGSIPEFMRKFGDVSIDEFFSDFSYYKKKVIIIDAAEKVFTNQNNVLSDFISDVAKKGWKVIFTIRSSFKDDFINYILRTDSWETLGIDEVLWDSLNQKLLEVDVLPPSDRKLQQLICNLFYLNLYVQTYDESSTNETKAQFYSKIWDIRVKGMPHCLVVQSIAREEFVCLMFQTIMDNNSYYYKPVDNSTDKTINMLINDTVISHDTTFGGYYFTHDVFEEMVAQFIIKREYKKSAHLVDFFSSLGISLPIRKYYRHWLLENLDENLLPKILSIFANKEINKIWKDETLIALMTDVERPSTLVTTNNLLAQNDFALLLKAVLLLNTACRILDRHFFHITTPSEQVCSRLAYRFTQPSGAGWDFIIKYIADNVGRINWTEKFMRPVVEMLTTWVNAQKHGDTTRFAGKIALFLYNKSLDDKYSYWDKDLQRKMFNIISSSAHEIKDEVILIITSVIETTCIDRRVRHIDLCEYFVSNVLNCSVICEAIPEHLIALCNKLWCRRKSDPKKENFHPGNDVEDAFGLSDWVHFDCQPTSAYQTPIFSLLRFSPQKTLKFIINFLNDAVSNFYKSDRNRKYHEIAYIDIDVEDNLTITKFCGGRLWGLYRGIGGGPELLECMLMALEKWLLEYIKQSEEELANDLCQYLLKESNNVCITSVITSLVTAYPEKLFRTALWLISFKDIFYLDNQRYIHEDSTNWFRNMPSDQIYNNERLESNKLEFRKRTFEQTILKYQIHAFGDNEEDWDCKKSQLYKCIDKLAERVSAEDTTTRFALNRIDLRRYHPDFDSQLTQDDGKTYIPFVVDEEPDLTEIREQNDKQIKETFKYTNILLWARARFEKEPEEYSKYPIYEKDSILAFCEFKQVFDDLKAGKNLEYFSREAPVFGAAVLIRDFQPLLNEIQIDFCCNILRESMPIVFSLVPKHEVTDGTLAILSSMPFLISRAESDRDEQNNLIISYAMALLTDSSYSSCKLFATTMWSNQPIAASIIFLLHNCLLLDFNTWLRNIRQEGKKVNKFISQHKRKIEDIITSNKEVDASTLAKFDVNNLMKIALILDINSETHYKLFLQIADSIFQSIFYEPQYNDYEKNLNFDLVLAFTDWLADYIYLTSETKADRLIKLAMTKASGESRYVNYFLTHILLTHDKVKDNNKFWHIWNELFPYIKVLCGKYKEAVINLQNTHFNELNEIIATYCFAWPWWGEQQKHWLGVQRENLSFFNMIAKEIGYMPETLYSIARFLCTIGSDFIVEGTSWLATIIEQNPHLSASELMTDTIYYLEDILINLVATNENDVRKKDVLRKDVLCTLNYLVEKGSTVGFLIREELF